MIKKVDTYSSAGRLPSNVDATAARLSELKKDPKETSTRSDHVEEKSAKLDIRQKRIWLFGAIESRRQPAQTGGRRMLLPLRKSFGSQMYHAISELSPRRGYELWK